LSGVRRADGARAAILLAATLLLTCCVSGRRPPALAGREPASFGVYRGSFRERDGTASRFRLLLFAELPDRMHAEVVPPVGGPRLILDGGGGKLAVSVVDRRTAYVGSAEADSVLRAIGAPVPLSSLVRALVLGEDPSAPDVTIVREPEERPGFPEIFEIRWEGRILRIDLVKMQPMRGTGPSIGSGTPPEGFSVHPMDEIDEDEGPLLGGSGR